ncbi:MAG: two-component sensor histidine kinase, partial [Marmoricola sp.]
MTHDQVDVVLIAAGWTAAVGAAGLVVSRVIARGSFKWLVALVALVAVGGVIAGVIGTANAMFLSSHDRGVVLLVCLVAGLVAVFFSFVVSASVVRGSDALREETRRFGETGVYAASAAGPAELQAVSTELARTAAKLQESREREEMLEIS